MANSPTHRSSPRPRTGQRNGAARVSTRIRLVKTQNIVAVAEMSDGSAYMGKRLTKVARGGGGCG